MNSQRLVANTFVSLQPIALLIVLLGTASGYAGSNDLKPTVVVHPRYVPYVPVSPYAPYYYSRWNPYSIYSILRPFERRSAAVPFAERAHRVQN